MSQTDTLLIHVWTKVYNAMLQMLELEPMKTDAFMKLYNDIDNYFKSPERDVYMLQALSNRPKSSKESDKKDKDADKMEADEKGVEIIIPGGELYYYLRTFLRAHLEEIAKNGNNLQDEAFLRFYAKTWEKYQLISKIVNKLFTSMNNNWVSRQYREGASHICEVFTMAMRIWQDVFFKESNQSLAQTCFKLIKDERDGQKVDTRLIAQVVQSYVSAGFTEDERKNRDNRTVTMAPSLETYNRYFEKQFLEETVQFYQVESNQFFENNSVNDYLKKITQRIIEEERRAKELLHPTTLEKLQPKIEKILIEDKLEQIHAEAKRLLHDENIADLRVLFELVNRVNNGNTPIQNDLEEFAYKTGINAVERVKATANKEPKTYVEAIIEVYMRFFTIISEGFCCEPGYTAALDKACDKFINNNAVTQEAKKSTKSAELLARYCDALLRKGNKIEDSDVETKINQIMSVFNYIEDKDVFQKFYGKMLAKRLVGQLSASDDHEESMLTKLRTACGFEYASRLQRMFQDIRLSTTLLDNYETYCQRIGRDGIVDFSVMVLTSNAWPFTAPPPFNLSIELQPTFDSFTHFYTQKHNGRKLEWLHQYSKGELQTLYTKPKYTLQVSTYQMAILLLFNSFDRMTVEALLDATQIDSELFVQILLNLLKSQVLQCAEINSNEINDTFKESEIKRHYTIQVDDNFKSKKVKINLNQPIKSVEQKDTDTVNQSVEEDRKMLIQAAIVRIMKARKELRYNALVQEVIPQLTSRFKPQIPMIKKCIDLLIDKEYLERDSKERDLFRYLA